MTAETTATSTPTAPTTTAPTSPATTAAEALRLVGNNPSRAIELADLVITEALARRELRKLDLALSDIHEAIRLAEQAGSRQAAAEAQMSLVSVHAERGEMRAALRASERAAAGLRGVAAARMRVQRGAMLCRLGKFTEAINEFRAAL